MPYYKIIIAVLCLFVGIAYASSDAVINKKLSGFQTLSADFVQTLTTNDGQVLQESKGKVFISRPGKLAWIVESPMPQTIIADGTKLSVYDPSLNQVSMSAMDSSSEVSYPALLLSSSDNSILKRFDVTDLGEDSFKLVPPNADSLFRDVVLTFSGSKLEAIVIHDQLDQIITIQFVKEKLNIPISNDSFVLNLPKDVDRVDLG
jgi:outer membrane lipoprotein carrier protein